MSWPAILRRLNWPLALGVLLAVGLVVLGLLGLYRVANGQTPPQAPCEVQLARTAKLCESCKQVRDVFEAQIATLQVELERMNRELYQARSATIPQPGSVTAPPGATPGQVTPVVPAQPPPAAAPK